MGPLEQARQWLQDESPSAEEVRQSIDNLCHQLAGCRSLETQQGLQGAISLLMSQLGENPPELSLPECSSPAELDYGNLVQSSDWEPETLTEQEKRQRFEELRDHLARPF